MYSQEKQIHFRLSENQHKSLKIRIALDGISLQEYLEKLITKDLESGTVVESYPNSRSLVRKEDLDFLRLLPIFKDISDDELRKMASAAIYLECKKGQILERHGDTPSMFYIIKKGKVFIFNTIPSGREFIIDIRVEGDTFASLATLSNRPGIASMKAAEEVSLIAFRRADFTRFISQNPSTMLSIIEGETSKLLNTYGKLINIAQNPSSQRVANTILMLSSKYGNNLSFTHQDIADMSGTTIETVTRFLSYCKRDGIIDVTRGKIKIINKDKLQSMPGYQVKAALDKNSDM